MAHFQDPDSDVANPFVLGDIILDGDEDAQVVVWEDGAPTWWALQFAKWRAFFHIPDDAATPSSASDQAVIHAPNEIPEDSSSTQGSKRSAEEAGLELN